MANNRLPLKNNKYKNMKLLRLLLPFLSLGIILSACQKDYSAESGTAKGNIVKDAAGDCAPILVNGAYVKDVVLGATNYADVQVNITQLGIYNIKSDTVNGYFFSGTGYAATEGLTTIRLTAIGKPVAAGLNLLTLKFDASTCVINVVVTATGGGGGGTAAVFTLNGSPTACAASTQTTNFFAGLPTTTANTVTVFANVLTAGTYSINTGITPINGLTFIGAGTLPAGTNVPITLTASGTPTAAGATFTYPLAITTVPASNCSFTLTVLAALSPATYTFNCPSASVNGTYVVGTAMNPATNRITMPVTVITPGTYNISTTLNGVTFAAIGVLTATPSVQNITLIAVGNPEIAGVGINNFIFNGGGGASCSVPVTYTAPPPATGFIRAIISPSTTLTDLGNLSLGASFDNTTVPGITEIEFGGINTAGERILINLKVLGAIATNTNYNVNQSLTGVVIDAEYETSTATGNILYTITSDILTTQPTPLTVRFTTANNSHIVGTFSGRMDEALVGPGFKTFNGSFDITY
jgi:hypothetical protein